MSDVPNGYYQLDEALSPKSFRISAPPAMPCRNFSGKISKYFFGIP